MVPEMEPRDNWPKATEALAAATMVRMPSFICSPPVHPYQRKSWDKPLTADRANELWTERGVGLLLARVGRCTGSPRQIATSYARCRGSFGTSPVPAANLARTRG